MSLTDIIEDIMIDSESLINAPRLGDNIGRWQLILLPGKAIVLNSLGAKCLFLEFLYIGRPCVKSISILNDLGTDYDNNQLTIIGINPLDRDYTA
jgi:hypothetical protein